MMAVIEVTTKADVVNASDGVVSLREAIAAAVAGEQTEIQFDPAVFAPATGNTPLALEDTLIIPTGADLIIDGSLVSANQALTLDGSGIGARVMTVSAGASVTL